MGRPENAAKVVHMLIIKQCMENTDEMKPYWEYEPVKAIENEEALVLWIRTIIQIEQHTGQI